MKLVEPDKVRGKGGKQLVDVIALVRHAIDPNTPLAPVGMTVEERYQQWIAEKQVGGRNVYRRSAAVARRHQGPHRQQPEHRAGRLRRSAVQSRSAVLDERTNCSANELAGILDELNVRLAA